MALQDLKVAMIQIQSEIEAFHIYNFIKKTVFFSALKTCYFTNFVI